MKGIAMDDFTFRNVGNSYFNGNDVVATRVRDGREVKINGKDGYLAVNVKDHKHGYGMFTGAMPEDVKAMAEELDRANASQYDPENWGPTCESELLYERAKETFWNDAEWLAKEAGFRGVSSSGRSGGWCCIDGMTADDAADLILHLDHTDDCEDCDPEDGRGFCDCAERREDALRRRSELLNLLIDIEDLIPQCHTYWYDDIREAHAEFVRLREENFVRGEN